MSLVLYMSSQTHFFPRHFPPWKMKLLIFTCFTEVSWRSVNIYTVLGKCKALWATLRLGLNSKAENPPPIIPWTTLRTWAGTETEFRKMVPDNFRLKLWHHLLLKLFVTFFQVGEKIWGVTISYKFSCLLYNISKRCGKYRSRTKTNYLFFLEKKHHRMMWV